VKALSSTRAVVADLRRHWRHFAAASVGIALGVGALVFFVGLGVQVRSLLLDQVVNAGFVEVVPRSAGVDLFALRIELADDTLDPAAIEDLEAIGGVAAVYPKMRLTAPAMASGGSALFGAGLQTEIVADGVDPRLVRDDVGGAFREVDGEVPDTPCSSDAQCGVDAYCGGGRCRPLIPAVVSPYIIELYNGGFRRAYDLPKVNPEAFVGMTFEMVFGASTFRRSASPPIRERMRLAGVSDAAIPLGVTLPLGHVRRLNVALGSQADGERYHSAVLELARRRDLPRVVAAAERLGLEVHDRGARRAALATAVVLAVFALVGLVLVAISVAHIMHVFYLVVMVRRREIGVLRAVGAQRGDIRRLLVAEAAVMGFASGLVGVLGALAAAGAADLFAARQVPDFPFKPETFFAFPPWLIVAALVLAVTSCVVGSLPPAARAVAGDPARALAGR
jgi:hypothetical protein